MTMDALSVFGAALLLESDATFAAVCVDNSLMCGLQ
jgi:hypothetical protein